VTTLLFLKPALVIAVAAAITVCLRRHSAAARHAVWAGAIVGTSCLPALGLVLPSLRIASPVTPVAALLPSNPVSLPMNEVATGPVGAAPLRNREGQATVPLARWILAAWILGALVLVARRVRAEVLVRGIVRRSRPASNQPAHIRLSDEVTTPAVAGVLRPVILLPAAADSWPAADLTAVLAHEVGHIARRDGLLNLWADLTAAIYWCNPLVHVGVRRMRSESERACDDRVLAGGAEPEGYAHLLLELARTAGVTGQGLPVAATAMARPRELESRLLAVLDPRVRRHPPPRWMSAGLGGLAILVALPTAAITLRAAPLTAVQLRAPEPDRLDDSLADPGSERLPLPSGAYRLSPAGARALAGPDSVLARRLVAALDHEPVHAADLIRDRAAWALSQARDGVLVEPLLEALGADDWRVRSYAAWTLAIAHDARAVEPLIGLVGHPVWRLRAMAASALRTLGDPRAEATMTAALVDPAWQVRVEAVEYLAALGGPALTEKLRPRLNDRHVAVRLAAARAFSSR
jgi:beta-lactamase regulating signal transducer with metallopeptidase domain